MDEVTRFLIGIETAYRLNQIIAIIIYILAAIGLISIIIWIVLLVKKIKKKRKKVTDKKPAVLKAQPVNFSGAKNFQLFNGKTVGRAGGGNTNFTAYLIEQNKNFV